VVLATKLDEAETQKENQPMTYRRKDIALAARIAAPADEKQAVSR